ncbi:hypothetical protein PILCRDRAFT_638365 [Piloderma croceum F 1598]|uniref:DUF6534 domain-containing protein n=1 Tax=Piloderma croceum (strain F 1598) TaxID=765440 RepID=A0A0C3ASD2_PILCF|nr:hypothetical protein PILCRDRAFT_638365 [Piloderma croceum F 1598]
MKGASIIKLTYLRLMSNNIQSDLGAIFLGDLAAAIFYGITCVQTFTYYQVFGRDHLALKLAVFFLWMLDTLQLAIITYNAYNFAVLGWGDTTALDLPIWTFWAQMIVTTISDFIIRFIYGSRIWRLSNKHLGLTAAITVSTLFVVGITFTLAIKSLIIGTNEYLDLNPYVLYLCLGSSAIADAIIASSLCVLLFRNRTHIRRTNSLLNTLMLYTICTGMLTGLYTIVLIVYAALPLRAVFAALFSLFGKI